MIAKAPLTLEDGQTNWQIDKLAQENTVAEHLSLKRTINCMDMHNLCSPWLKGGRSAILSWFGVGCAEDEGQWLRLRVRPEYHHFCSSSA